jgi:hypothetical protein
LQLGRDYWQGALAYTQHENLVLLQILAVTRLYGVSFLIAWFASVGSWVWMPPSGPQQQQMVVFGASPLALI